MTGSCGVDLMCVCGFSLLLLLDCLKHVSIYHQIYINVELIYATVKQTEYFFRHTFQSLFYHVFKLHDTR